MSLLLQHYQNDHSHLTDFHIMCTVDGCLRSYRLISSLRKHLLRNHKKVAFKLLEEISLEERMEDAIQLSEDDTVSITSELQNLSHIPGHSNSTNKSVSSLTRFLLSIREKGGLTEKVSSSIIEEYSSQILDKCIKKTRAIVDDIITLDFEQKSDILTPLLELKDEHDKCNTVFKQRKIFEKSGFIKPVEVKLGENDSLMYINILDNLKALLSHDDILEHVLSPPEHGKLIGDFSCGSSFKGNTLYTSHKQALQINLYLDDFQVVNPLGNKVKKHKICAFYWTLGNLPHHLQSKLYTIQLACLTQSTNIKKYGFENVLASLINDLKHLEEEGIVVNTNGNNYHFLGL